MVDVDEMKRTWWCSEGRKRIPRSRSAVPLSVNHNMEESLIPSLSAGVVGSRFITQDEVETVKLRREEQWKAAYARLVVLFHFVCVVAHLHRLGQEPPPQQQEDAYDGRSLAEVSSTSIYSFRVYSHLPLGFDIHRNSLPIRSTSLPISTLICSKSPTDSEAGRMGGKNQTW